MMRMMMRLQKGQVPSVIKKTSGEGVFSKALHVLAGYKELDFIIVGASAGFSGDAKGSNSTNNMAYGGGPGGGGGIFGMNVQLSTLANDIIWTIGEAGRDGVDSGNTVKAENGISGGNTYFGDWGAYGGRPPTGGKIDQVSGGVGFTPSKGGDGGENSLGLPDGGIGGNKGSYPPPAAPTAGDVYVIPPTGQFYGLSGGGGGCGRTKVNGANENSAQAGANGSTSGSNEFVSVGGPSVNSKGGPGGGVNIGSLQGGVTEIYGTKSLVAQSPGGAMILRFD